MREAAGQALQHGKPPSLSDQDRIEVNADQLGTALYARQALTSFVTYDKRLLDAVIAAGLPADSPV
jgi:hypothetical protein